MLERWNPTVKAFTVLVCVILSAAAAGEQQGGGQHPSHSFSDGGHLLSFFFEIIPDTARKDKRERPGCSQCAGSFLHILLFFIGFVTILPLCG